MFFFLAKTRVEYFLVLVKKNNVFLYLLAWFKMSGLSSSDSKALYYAIELDSICDVFLLDP